MTDDADDDKPSDAKPRAATDPPETRKQEAVPPPVAAEAALDLNGPLTYPDDSGLATQVRQLDHYIGVGEQVVLVAMLATVVLTAATHAILDRLFHVQLDFKDEVVRAGTFAIAIIGSVFATQQARHLAMDLISRRLSPRNRLVLKILLALFTAFIVVLLTHAGFHTIEIEKTMQQHSQIFSSVMIAWIIPIGGFLMLIHLLLHTVIDVDYLLRGKTPPERVRSGH